MAAEAPRRHSPTPECVWERGVRAGKVHKGETLAPGFMFKTPAKQMRHSARSTPDSSRYNPLLPPVPPPAQVARQLIILIVIDELYVVCFVLWSLPLDSSQAALHAG